MSVRCTPCGYLVVYGKGNWYGIAWGQQQESGEQQWPHLTQFHVIAISRAEWTQTPHFCVEPVPLELWGLYLWQNESMQSQWHEDGQHKGGVCDINWSTHCRCVVCLKAVARYSLSLRDHRIEQSTYSGDWYDESWVSWRLLLKCCQWSQWVHEQSGDGTQKGPCMAQGRRYGILGEGIINMKEAARGRRNCQFCEWCSKGLDDSGWAYQRDAWPWCIFRVTTLIGLARTPRLACAFNHSTVLVSTACAITLYIVLCGFVQVLMLGWQLLGLWIIQ